MTLSMKLKSLPFSGLYKDNLGILTIYWLKYVCMVDTVNNTITDQDTITAKQANALHGYVAGVVTVLGPMAIKGHNDFTDAKACPSFKVHEKFPKLVEWAAGPVGPWPFHEQHERQPAPVVAQKYCRRCHRRLRM